MYFHSKLQCRFLDIWKSSSEPAMLTNHANQVATTQDTLSRIFTSVTLHKVVKISKW